VVVVAVRAPVIIGNLYLPLLKCLESRDKSGLLDDGRGEVRSRVIWARVGLGRKILMLRSGTPHLEFAFQVII
jgi:hypothetical protein